MNIAVRYQSRGGNTKTVAEIIAKAIGVTAEPLDVPLDAAVDILFLGGGVYAWTIDNKIEDYINNLTSENVKNIAAFSTAGGFDGAKRIVKLAKEKGIKTFKKTLPLKVLLKNHAMFTGGRGHFDLSEKQIKRITEFAFDILKEK